MSKVLFIQPKDITIYTSINGSVDVDKIVPFILKSQEIYIQDILGTKLYEKLKTDVQNFENSGVSVPVNYATLLNTYIKPVLIHYTLMSALPYLSITISNGGVYRYNPDNSTSLSKNEIDSLVNSEKDAAQYFSQRLLDFLNYNSSSMFPEFYQNTNEDISPSYEDNFNGWYLK